MARAQVRDERRAQILDAMYDVVAERGLAGASVSEIAEAAGIARGALHYFFASKDEITASLMRRLGERYREQLSAYLDRRVAAGSRALVADLATWHFKGDSGDVLRRMAVWIDFWGQAASAPDIGLVVLEIQDAARAVLARALVAERPALAALGHEALRIHGGALLAVIEGGLLQWRVAASTPSPLDRDALGAAVAAAAQAAAAAIPAPAARKDAA